MSKTVNKMAAQGDVMVIRVDQIPEGLRELAREDGQLLVAHSETGHHHVIERPSVQMYEGDDPLEAWLEVHDESELPNIAELVHDKSWDTHETLELPVGKYKLRRQRESTPDGWRRAQD